LSKLTHHTINQEKLLFIWDSANSLQWETQLFTIVYLSHYTAPFLAY
jgi:hypothetical protein